MHGKGIANKLVEKIGKEHPADQPLSNAHTAFGGLHLTFIWLYDSIQLLHDCI